MTTARFGLSDSFDNATIDAVLASLEVHDHTGGDRLPSPWTPAGLAATSTGGQLPGGTTYFYRYSLVDRFGFETAASSEVSVATTPTVRTPREPVVFTVPGGALGPGMYYYSLTALAGTDETTISDASIVQVVAGEGSVRVMAPTVIDPGATSYQVWRQGPNEFGPTRVGTFTQANGSYLDDGSVPPDDCACDPENLPPAFNQTSSTNSIVITLPVAGSAGAQLAAQLADPEQVSAWRLYRATTSGGYTSASLLAQVTTRVPAFTGGLVTAFTDDGTDVVQLGRPLTQSQALVPSIKIKAGGGGGGLSLVLAASNDTRWKVYADVDGTLVTRSTTAEPGTAVLIDADLVRWRLGVDVAGQLTIQDGAASLPQDNVYTLEDPLILPTPDPTFIYSVVIDAGSLVTTEA